MHSSYVIWINIWVSAIWLRKSFHHPKICFLVGGAELSRSLGPVGAFNCWPLFSSCRCAASVDRNEKPRCEVQQRHLCPRFCSLLQTGETVPLTLRALTGHRGVSESGFILSLSPLSLSLPRSLSLSLSLLPFSDSFKVYFPSGINILILNIHF